MGVLNVTPDSFYDGGRYFAAEKALERGLELINEGADIVDVGGESTRPGAQSISEDEELRRVIPVIKLLTDEGIPVSIDTCKSTIAKAAVQAGAVLINDISGLGFDPRIAEIAAHFDIPIVIMHMRGKPANMQHNPQYKDLMGEITEYLHQRTETALKAGVNREKILIDPGIGFGKTVQHNLEIIRRLSELNVLGYPIMIGLSRKSFIGKLLDLPVERRLFGTCGACAAAVMNGAAFLRVHDPIAVNQTITIVDYICGKRTCHENGIPKN